VLTFVLVACLAWILLGHVVFKDGVHIIFPLHLRIKYPKTLSLYICCLVKCKHDIVVLIIPLAKSLLSCYHAKIFLSHVESLLKMFLATFESLVICFFEFSCSCF